MSFPTKKPSRQKTYGKAVKAQLSGLFGRSLWAEAESSGVTKKDRKKRLAEDEARDGEEPVVPVSVPTVLETEAEDSLAGVMGGLKIHEDAATPVAPPTPTPTPTTTTPKTTTPTTTETEKKKNKHRKSESKSSIVVSEPPTSCASSVYECSDKENDTVPSPRAEAEKTPDIPTREPSTSPRSVLGERTLLEVEVPKESPPRQRGLRKRASAGGVGVQSPLRKTVTTPRKEAAETGIKVWEDATTPVKKRGKKVEEVKGEDIPEKAKKEQVVEKSKEEVKKAKKKIVPQRVVDIREEAKGEPALPIEEAETPAEEPKKTKKRGVPQKVDTKVAAAPSADTSPLRIRKKSDEFTPEKSGESSPDEGSSAESDLSEHSSLNTTVEEVDPTTELLSLCTVPEILSFTDHISKQLTHSKITKLGEASYSEVFLQTPRKSSLPTTILKIIPFGYPDQCELGQITQEVRITRAMSDIAGFIGFQGAYITRGAFPTPLMDAWDAFDEDRGSENERPDFYDDEQLFAVILLDHGGTDLEHTDLHGWEEACDVFWQVTLALARGEQQRQFEHRDLHFGNIVINRRESDPADLLQSLSLSDKSKTKTKTSTRTSNLKVSLIDYTLSRAQCGIPSVDGDAEVVEFAPLSDPALFSGKGDYQFDIYRFMRSALSSGEVDPSEEWIDWNVFAPRTNVFWLHYLCNILLNKKGLVRPGGGRRKEEGKERERECWRRLDEVARLIDPRKKRFGGVEVGSAEELAEWAVGEGLVGGV